MSKQAITANDVTIKQAVVEIKILKIGNKQVTQAVFKQLLDEPVIDPDAGELQGIPWGRVNYHVDCNHTTGHLHIVWQDGNKLYRSLAYLPWNAAFTNGYTTIREQLVNLARLYLMARALEGHTDRLMLFNKAPVYLEERDTIDVPPLAAFGTPPQGGPTQYMRWYEHVLAEQGFSKGDSDKIYHDFLLPRYDEIHYLGMTWQQSYEQLQQLDQLFIAV